MLNSNKKNKSEYISGLSFFKKYEFRLNENDRKSFLLIFKLFKRIFIRLNNSKPKKYQNSKILIFDGNKKGIETRIEYVKYFSNESEFDSFGLEESIYHNNNLDLLIKIIFSFSLTLFLFPLTFYPKHRTHFALLPTYFLETCGFINYCIKNQINKVHYFCIFEANANINALILKKLNIFCNKIPSEVPLYFHNYAILSDELSTCFAYQNEEVVFFSETMEINKVSNWGPENIVKVLNNNYSEFTSHQIGFYSSGVWLRSLKGNFTTNSNEQKAEYEILNTLINFVKKENLKPVLIFLHPSEKKNPEQLKLTKDFYGNHFDSSLFEFADVNLPSNQQFEKVDIAISFFSTIVFERLYMGYKTIIAPFNAFYEFPLLNSPIKNITVRNTDELLILLKDSIKVNNLNFFHKHQISNYSKIN